MIPFFSQRDEEARRQENSRRAEEDRQRMERERKERDELEAAQRDQKAKERASVIDQQKSVPPHSMMHTLDIFK